MENYSAIKGVNYYVHSMTIKNYHKNYPGSYSERKKSQPQKVAHGMIPFI